MVMHACSSRAWETKIGESQIQGQPEFKAKWDYLCMRPCLRILKQQTAKTQQQYNQ